MKTSFWPKCATAAGCLIVVIPILAAGGWLMRGRIDAWSLGISPARYSKMKSEKNIMVTMRDGVNLATDVIRPATNKPGPAILIRTSYDKEGVPNGGLLGKLCRFFNQRGYAVVVQDVRGRYRSEGKWCPWVNESRDGEDTVHWIQSQRWFDGSLGTVGASYLGCTQWALAPYARDVLKCMTPIVVSSSVYPCSYRGGLIGIGAALGWATGVGDKKGGDYGEGREGEGVNHLPIIDADDVTVTDVPFYNDWLDHDTNDSYWDLINKRPRIGRVDAPGLLITGWYDIFIGQQLTDYVAMRTSSGSPQARQTQIIVGPWGHGLPNNESEEKMLLGQIMRWNDYWIRGLGRLPEKPVKIFVMGRNVWREEEEWPLKRMQVVPFYFRSGGRANSIQGDGWLDLGTGPQDEAKDVFIFDPFNPVPSKGGCSFGGGSEDQAEVEARKDVLIYTSAPLKRPLEVTGPIRVILHAASSAVDTDFTAKLTDVTPDGRSLNLQEGIIRARRRNPDRDELLDPGTPVKLEIDLWATSNVFLKGHRIRVQISSSNFPQFDRNHNTGGNAAYETRMLKARQVVYHDAMRPSHIVLPVILSKGQRLEKTFRSKR